MISLLMKLPSRNIHKKRNRNLLSSHLMGHCHKLKQMKLHYHLGAYDRARLYTHRNMIRIDITCCSHCRS